GGEGARARAAAVAARGGVAARGARGPGERCLVRAPARGQPLHRLARDAGDRVEVPVVVENDCATHFGDCRDEQIHRARASRRRCWPRWTTVPAAATTANWCARSFARSSGWLDVRSSRRGRKPEPLRRISHESTRFTLRDPANRVYMG